MRETSLGDVERRGLTRTEIAWTHFFGRKMTARDDGIDGRQSRYSVEWVGISGQIHADTDKLQDHR